MARFHPEAGLFFSGAGRHGIEPAAVIVERMAAQVAERLRCHGGAAVEPAREEGERGEATKAAA